MLDFGGRVLVIAPNSVKERGFRFDREGDSKDNFTMSEAVKAISDRGWPVMGWPRSFNLRLFIALVKGLLIFIMARYRNSCEYVWQVFN